ncbi:zinc finger CCCH domain-containing protein 58-like isoform X2 [Mangifera indica]|uniref:zinc finger CCCH domain-containing protein 58-like isoform X2 n=1 Tax=Mangifera indica TaxID=29780 RepID=UPI001CFAE203|nr:zinc finger CCCH domain-containing protein 58-like isoform X2 [Mangifera indica]
MVMGAARAGAGEYPERAGQPLCKYYMRTGTCKFGSSCKYDHPRQGAGSVTHVTLNYYGYPLRPGEKECSYYLKTGQCKFGPTCKFHHPQPAGIQVPAPQVTPMPAPVPAPTIYPIVQLPSVPSAQQYGFVVPRPPLLPNSYVQGPHGLMLVSPGMFPYQSWSPYSTPVNQLASPGTQPAAGSSSIYGMTTLSASAPAYTGSYQTMPSTVGPSSGSQEHAFPERPGQPECQHYLKTGECKFGSSCKYHHPQEMTVSKTDANRLPLRPGASPCTHYTQRGVCKYGRACKFDHPVRMLNYSPSASSLADMPVAPYPVGSSIGVLAPSSSSSDLRPELVSGSSKEPVSTRMSSTISSTSGSVGSIFSKSGPIPHSSTQQSGQSSGSSTSGISSSTETRTSN